MNTDMIWQMHSTASVQTESLGVRIGKHLRGGEVIELVSDLGGGKTTFVRGLAKGAGSTDTVGSPSFTISREYTAPHFVIAHFDFYRLSEAGIVAEELRECVGQAGYVTVVEWGDVVADVLPHDRLAMQLIYTKDGGRDIRISCGKGMAYLLDGIEGAQGL